MIDTEALPNGRETTTPLLEVRDCHVRYGLVPALRGISLTVEEGEMVALLGPNGAGKTTTLRAVSGLVGLSQGSMLFQGSSIASTPPHKLPALGIAQVPEGRELFPGLTVRENLRYGYWPHRRNRAEFPVTLASVFDVFPRLAERSGQRAGTLSGGEQQMLAVGIAMMSSPRLLLVDELSLGLAPLVVSLLYEVLKEINKRGTAILLVEQFIPLALANTNRAYVLAKGDVAIAADSAKLRTDPRLVASYLGEGAVQVSTSGRPKGKRN